MNEPNLLKFGSVLVLEKWWMITHAKHWCYWLAHEQSWYKYGSATYIFTSDQANYQSNTFNYQLLHSPVKESPLMAFTSRSSKAPFQAPSNFISICNWLLLTVMVAHVVISAPTTDVSFNHSGGTQDLIGQVFNGLEILIGLGSHLNGTIFDIEDFQNVRISQHNIIWHCIQIFF